MSHQSHPCAGMSHHVQVKEPYGNSNWLFVVLHTATRVYIVHRLCPPRKFRRYGIKERKAVFYAIVVFDFPWYDLDRTDVLLLLTG